MRGVLTFDVPIETERLVLRRWHRDDFEALFDQQSDPDTARYLPRETRTRPEAEQALAARIASRGLAGDDDEISLAVVRREDGRVIGDLTLWLRSVEWAQAEIGYVFSPGTGGQGFATEAARALVDVAFDGLGAHRVYARADAANLASTRLLERLGMRCEARFRENQIFKGRWCEEVVYAVLAGEWPELRTRAGA
jgi:RimJ/RimL family protein N-acetyltransferase